jgi:hypothetical protein
LVERYGPLTRPSAGSGDFRRRSMAAKLTIAFLAASELDESRSTRVVSAGADRGQEQRKRLDIFAFACSGIGLGRAPSRTRAARPVAAQPAGEVARRAILGVALEVGSGAWSASTSASSASTRALVPLAGVQFAADAKEGQSYSTLAPARIRLSWGSKELVGLARAALLQDAASARSVSSSHKATPLARRRAAIRRFP